MTMTDKVLIQPLDLGDFDPSTYPSDPGFADLVNQELGDSATAADGFDPVWEDLVAIVDSLDSGLTLLGGQEGGDLDDTFADIATLDSGPVGDNLVAYQGALPAVSKDVDDLGATLTGAAPPTPPQPGTGGMTIGSATAPILAYGARQGMGPGACAHYPCVTASPICNHGSTDIHFSSITLVQHGTIWSATTDCTDTLGAGKCCSFRITANTQPGPTDVAQLQFAYDGPGSPAVFQVDGGVGSSGGSGGGGGGGGIRLNAPS